jgi:hypothetical protein
MPENNSNLSTADGQQAVAAAATKRKEDDASATAHTTATTMHWEQETLVAAVVTTRKTLDEARAREGTASLVWEKEKTIAHHLKQQLTGAQGISIPQDDDDDRSIDHGSNSDAAHTAHLHA